MIKVNARGKKASPTSNTPSTRKRRAPDGIEKYSCLFSRYRFIVTFLAALKLACKAGTPRNLEPWYFKRTIYRRVVLECVVTYPFAVISPLNTICPHKKKPPEGRSRPNRTQNRRILSPRTLRVPDRYTPLLSRPIHSN